MQGDMAAESHFIATLLKVKLTGCQTIDTSDGQIVIFVRVAKIKRPAPMT
jgi:hypothetical protein